MEAQEVKTTDWQTSSGFFVFLVGGFAAALGTWSAEKWVPGFTLKLELAALWLFPIVGGLSSYVAYRRGRTKKQTLDSVLLFVGIGLMWYADVVGKLAEYARSVRGTV